MASRRGSYDDAPTTSTSHPASHRRHAIRRLPILRSGHRRGVQAIRQEDPDGPIGGPSLAFTDDWVAPFLDGVVRDRLPLDFFAFHFYPGVPYREPDVEGVIRMVRGHLAKRPEISTTELHLNEYNAYHIDYPHGGSQDKFRLASALLHRYAFFLTQPDLTAIHWAQFTDSGGGNYSGMIDIDGHRKAVFSAYTLYGRMPVDRRRLTINGATGETGIEGLAAADSHRASVLLWNISIEDRALEVTLNHLPMNGRSLRVYRIDDRHASRGDRPDAERLTPVEIRPLAKGRNVAPRRVEWSGSLPSGAVVYLEAGDDSGLSELSPNPVARVVRLHHTWPDRSKRCYADFDRNTWIARLGMAGERSGDAVVGVTAEGWPDRLRTTVRADVSHSGIVFIGEETVASSDIGGLIRALFLVWERSREWEWTDRVPFLERSTPG